MGDERRDEARRTRADVYSSARIGAAAAALTLVLVVLLVLDVAVADYDISPGILLPLLGAILALLEATAVKTAGSEKAAAHRLGLSHSTVKHHLANARSKVGAETTAQLVWILAPRLPEPESRVRLTDQSAPSGLGDPLDESRHRRLDACAIDGPTGHLRGHGEAEQRGQQ
ncbi:MAG TPA: hypothetical protein VLH36_11230 [Steroidobacteraceae bacterium]|nr:hypothetical protein [Steroidobacteraceae bacterium]